MQAIQTYNGWSNRETWLAGLWLNNDQDSHQVLLDARHQGDELFDQADWLEQELREQLDCTLEQADLWRDLLATAFNRINWVEVIENS